MKNSLMIIDAFADKPFCGNPAAVCLLESAKDEAWMQNIASEMNLSETAFVVPRKDGFDLRWFTPNSEVDLCGHATLATAHALWETGQLDPEELAVFHTKSGILEVTQIDNGYCMDFPAQPAEEFALPSELLDALGVSATWTGRNRMDFIVQVDSEQTVANLEPDFTRLMDFETRGIIVTAKSDKEGCDFVSRFFCPLLGINEDPVTGSAHCCLGPFWQQRLEKSELIGVQLSKRGGRLGVIVEDDRVLLIGRAVTVLNGSLGDVAM